MGISRSAFIEGVRVNPTGRRTFTPEYKQELVRKCRAPGVSVSAIALAHGLNANVLRKWLRQQTAASSARPSVPSPILLPVTVATMPVRRTKKPAASPLSPPAPHAGSIDIELNGARIRVQGAVDGNALRCILDMLRQQ